MKYRNTKKIAFFAVFFMLALNTVLAQGTIKKIDKAALKEVIKADDVQLIDVRTAEEYEAEHIGNAVNFNIIDRKMFVDQIKDLDRQKPVYVYCKIGGRSKRAAKLLKEKGFVEIYDYSGGYNDWVSE